MAMSRRESSGRSGKGDANKQAELGEAASRRTPKKKAGGARRTRVKARFDKKSGDVRNKPNTRADGTEKKASRGPTRPGDIRYLRGLGHHLKPVVQLGKEGLTDAVVAATAEALRAHELIKVKFGTEWPTEREERFQAAAELATRTASTLVQVLGRTLLLYKRHPSKPKITFPDS